MGLKYMRKDEKDEFGIKKLQDKILEIMVEMDTICNSNNIEYTLMGGSALGAMRHNGFIPWDDDLDIFMTPKNYRKFKKNIIENNKYYLQEYSMDTDFVTIAKVRMNNTTFIEDVVKDWDMHHGIYVDIFILHNSPDKKLKQYKQFFWAKYLIYRGLSFRNYNKRKGVTRILLKLGKLIPKNFLIKKAFKEVYKYENIETSYVCNFLGKAMFKKGLYEKKWFAKIKRVPFENVKLSVPDNLEEFLSSRFGNYMKIPSHDQIIWSQHASIWDVQNDFSEYLKGVNTFNDEKKLL